MKLGVCFAFSLLALGQARDCEIYRVRGFEIPMTVGPRKVSVLLERDMKIWINFQHQDSLTLTDRKWHDLTTKKNGSDFCVAAPTLLGNETCSGSHGVISLRTNSTTSWKLDCPGVAEAPQGSRQCRRHQLYAVHLGLDSIPASFYWKPNAVVTGLAVSDRDNSPQIWAMDKTIWKDVTLGRDSGGRPCRVCSKRLNKSFPCAQKLISEDYITFESINDNINKSISYFAFECSGIPDENVTETPSPSNVPPTLPPTNPWLALAIVGAVALVVIAVVLVVVKVRKSRSSREAAIPADDLHDPGCDDDRENDHDYCYVDVAFSNAHLEEERRATRTDCGGETTSLRSHDSENSVYGEIHPNVSQREGQ